MSRASRAEKKAKKNKVTISDQYDESSRVLTDAEAHRDVSYELPSFLSQMLQCFKVQMKRYTRQKIMWISLVLLALIPIIYYSLKAVSQSVQLLPETDFANIYMANLLSFGGLAIPLLSAIACGSMLSQEFNERTVFLSLPLPMSRFAFYIGKFFAALVLIEGTVAAAYGISILIAMQETTYLYSGSIFTSFLLAMTFAFFCCAISYAMSTKLRRGSSMLPFITVYIVLPVLGIVGYVLSDIEIVKTVCTYIPSFEMDMAINCLGDATTMTVSGIVVSMFVATSMLSITFPSNIALMISVTILISILLLYLGYRVVKRRDM